MRYILLFWIFLVTVSASDPYKNITSYTLDNGLKVYLYPDNKAQNTAINVDVKVGMKAENKENAGISHLVEHIVFRDARIEDRDYLDLFISEGASYVNGYTKYFKTQYVATIKSEKSYWIVEQFAQMILDKNVTQKDLDVERGALQVEIGEFTWVDRYAPSLEDTIDFIKDIFPPEADFYKDEFGIDIKEEQKRKYFSRSVYRSNNQKFTLSEVMKHYEDYYYPANMTLNVVGNFDLAKMQEVIQESFGKFTKRDGKSVIKKVEKVAKLNKKPFKKYDIGLETNSATIGTKFIADDPKKIIILQSYVRDLARRLNKVFRNKNGESYGAYGSYSHHHDGAIATISFNAKLNAFDKNILYAQEQIKKEINGELSDEMIFEALKASKKFYTSQEHDSSTLMNMIFNIQNFQRVFKNAQSPYALLESVTAQEFKTVVQQAFTTENSYNYIARSYKFFPYEAHIFFGLLSLAMLYLIYRFYGTKVDKKVRLKRRLTSKFVSFFVILISVIIAAIITEWIFYFSMKVLPISNLWANGYDAPLSYMIYFVDFLISIFVLYWVIKILFKWFYIKLYVTDHTLIVSGANSKYIQISDIKDMDIIRWSPAYINKSHGMSLLVWRPLLKITSHQNEAIYLRSYNAKDLKSDLEFTIFEKNKSGERW